VEQKVRLARQKAEQERAQVGLSLSVSLSVSLSLKLSIMQAEIARGMEAVGESALQRSILLSRIPRCQGQAMCQFNGKEAFVSIFLELADGVLRMNDGDTVLRTCVALIVSTPH
jgi:hypothetical protein